MAHANALYRPILKQAWQTTLKYKHLWFFGLFAALVSSGGEYEIILHAVNAPTNEGILGAIMSGLATGWSEGAKVGGVNLLVGFWQTLTQDPVSLIIILLVLALTISLTLFLIWLSTVSQIGLIRNAYLLVGKAKILKKPTLNEGIDFGMKYFWPVLGINVVLRVILSALFAVLSGVYFWIYKFDVLAGLFYVLVFIIFILLTLIVSFLLKYQILFLLIKKQKFLEALASAWKLFLDNWLISLEMAVLMLLAFLIAALITATVAVFLWAIPMVVLPLSFSFFPAALKFLLALVAVTLIIIISVLITAMIATFQWTGWTILFTKISEGEALAKLERLAQGLQFLPKNLGK